MKAIISILKASYARCRDSLAYLAGLLIAAMLVYVTVNIVTRYLGHPIEWVYETSEYSLFALTFLAAAWLLKRGGQVRIDIVPMLLKRKAQAGLNIATSVVLSAVCLAITIWGALTTYDFFIHGWLQHRLLIFPKWILVIFIPIGGFFLFVEAAVITYGYIQEMKKSQS